ncbi:cellulase family glycosylhydrolase [Bacteroides oleiciplenus]|uniref:cellulase family glycosylhydrolase n=1 Tax=Bacteroides oleiciplenus TaxID=626931 RepID=UPI0026DD9F1A|nr:cellulase family glycosylhydrolase [Bacteroides oleiciplenus]
MKRIIKELFFLGFILLLTSCSDDPIQEVAPPEEPVGPVEPEPEPGDDNNSLPLLSVVGRYLKNTKGEIVNLHGFTQTYSPYFNNGAWSNYDVQACLNYNKRMVDGILTAGWKFNFVRLHLDPYWSDDTSMPYVRYEGHERFSEARFRKYLDELFVPMAEYFISKGMYVVMRPPGVCPNREPADKYQGIEVGDTYQQFLLKVWDIVSQHAKLKNNSGIMFELANEPVNIKGTDGVYGSTGDACFANTKIYFQAIVDKIRSHCNNIIWVPGLAYQSSYAGYATHRIEGENIGFAVHCYPGWYGSDAEQDSGEGIGSSTGGGYEAFQRGWDAQVGPVAAFAPIMVTEIDWAPKKYDATWGKSVTGTAGGEGFGANFKYIADNSGNVSWLFFTTRSHELAAFKDVPGEPGNYTFLNDPEACPWAMYHWFKEYAEGMVVNGELEKLELVGQEGELRLQMGGTNYLKVKATYSDETSRMVTAEADINSSNTAVLKVERAGKLVAVAPGEATITVTYQSATGVSKQLSLKVTVISPFSLTADVFNPSIWENGTFDEATRTLVTGQYGFGGWQYADGLDLSGYKTLTVELGNDSESSVSFRLFDKTSYWTKPATYNFDSSRKVVVELNRMIDEDGVKIDSSHLYIVGFWSMGGKPIIIANIALAN